MGVTYVFVHPRERMPQKLSYSAPLPKGKLLMKAILGLLIKIVLP